jgi:hypothetical protein
MNGRLVHPQGIHVLNVLCLLVITYAQARHKTNSFPESDSNSNCIQASNIIHATVDRIPKKELCNKLRNRSLYRKYLYI